MKIVVSQYKKITPFITLYRVHNQLGRLILNEVGKKYLDTTDLYALQKLGFKITEKIITQ